MNAPLFRSSLFLASVLLVPLLGRAQAPPAGDMNQLIGAVNKLSQQMTALNERLDQAATSDELKQQIESLTALISEQDAELQQLKNGFEQLKDMGYQLHQEQQQVLDTISRQDSQGNRVLSLRNIMDNSKDFQQEMSTAVHDSMKTSGTMRINNKTLGGKYVRVNGTQYYLPAGAVQDVTVPVGSVMTELVGWESPKTWTVGPPNYLQSIDINPRQSVYVESWRLPTAIGW
jgi:hypothetical protein